MTSSIIDATMAIFATRLDTLEHLLNLASEHFKGDELWIEKRIAPDVHPLGTQVALTCSALETDVTRASSNDRWPEHFRQRAAMREREKVHQAGHGDVHQEALVDAFRLHRE